VPKTPLLLVGAGGHAVSCIDVIERTASFSIFGLLDLPERVGGKVLGYPIVGADEDMARFIAQCPNALVTLGQVGAPTGRRRIVAALRSAGARLPVVASPDATLSASAQVEDGTWVGHGAILNAGCRVGTACIVNSRALIEHDARVGAYCHISTGAILNGGTVVEDDCFIGSGAVVREGITVGAGSFVGAGALVTRNCPPASIIKRRGDRPEAAS
jgi:sugar O-acyltransferase (sialic acid O-acetyltransferase NeuD family)